MKCIFATNNMDDKAEICIINTYCRKPVRFCWWDQSAITEYSYHYTSWELWEKPEVFSNSIDSWPMLLMNAHSYSQATIKVGKTECNLFQLLPVFMKIIGHVRHFRWLGPNVWWEISQIWIECIKLIRQMSDESWKFFRLHCITGWMLRYIVIGSYCPDPGTGL